MDIQIDPIYIDHIIIIIIRLEFASLFTTKNPKIYYLKIALFFFIMFWLCFNLVIVKVISKSIDLIDHWYSSLLIYKAASWCQGGLDLAFQGVLFFSFSYW